MDLSTSNRIQKPSTRVHGHTISWISYCLTPEYVATPGISVQTYSTATSQGNSKVISVSFIRSLGETFSMNSTAHFFLVAEFLDLLGIATKKGDGRGCVIITSSCASIRLCTNVYLTSYAVSKAATDHIVRMLAV